MVHQTVWLVLVLDRNPVGEFDRYQLRQPIVGQPARFNRQWIQRTGLPRVKDGLFCVSQRVRFAAIEAIDRPGKEKTTVGHEVPREREGRGGDQRVRMDRAAAGKQIKRTVVRDRKSTRLNSS